jgi:hypothetical protein
MPTVFQFVEEAGRSQMREMTHGQAFASLREKVVRVSRAPRVAIFLCLISAAAGTLAQPQDVLCDGGNGSFQAKFQSTGVAVQVGASRNGELARRSCEAILIWNKHSLPVATDASQVDIDEFGAEIGLGEPVAAFQVKKSERDCCREYYVYSLKEPPRLLQRIIGGESFTAADTDLDGRAEIWTNDAAATSGIDGLTLGEFTPPTIVLRFSRGKLLDVSGEFSSYFDGENARLRDELDRDDVREFKSSDGKLSLDSRLSAEQLHKLRRVKGKILGIVWGYLYSGRERQAWDALAGMWPAGDIGRIRAAILDARARGIGAQTVGISVESNQRKKHTTIFDATGGSTGGRPEVTPPEAILLTRPALIGTSDQWESMLDLVVDFAGKVRSVEPAGRGTVDPALIQATAGWKFTPASKDGRAVACRIRLSVSLRR